MFLCKLLIFSAMSSRSRRFRDVLGGRVGRGVCPGGSKENTGVLFFNICANKKAGFPPRALSARSSTKEPLLSFDVDASQSDVPLPVNQPAEVHRAPIRDVLVDVSNAAARFQKPLRSSPTENTQGTCDQICAS